MEFRPLTDEDVAAPPAWLAAEADLRPDRWRDDCTRAIVGLEGGVPVAVGRIFPSRVHTSRFWTEIVVDPGRRRQGVGTDVAAELARLRPDDRPMCARGSLASAAVLFARSLGARPYQTCPPEQVRTSSAASLAAQGGVVVVAGADVTLEELRRAWTDTYAWAHETWSPVADGFEEPLLAGFDADLDRTHTRVVAGSEIRAAAFVFRGQPHPVVVAECRSRHQPDGLGLLRACVRASLLSLAADGTEEVIFDGHDTDPHFRPLLDELPATGEPFVLLEWD